MLKIMIIAGLGYSLVNFRGDLIKSWFLAGYDVIAVAPGSDVKEELESIGASYHSAPLERTGMNPFADIYLLFYLIRLLRTEKPDYLFLYTIKPIIYGSLAAMFIRKVKVYSMVTGLGNAFNTSGRKKGFLSSVLAALYRISLSRNERVFFQNPDDRAYFFERNLVKPDKVVMVNGSGVNLDYYKSKTLPSGPPVFLMIARLIREKGFSEYVEAARTLRIKYPDARFQMVCWAFDENPSAIRKADVQKWSEQGIVEVFDKTHDVRPFIEGSSVFVLPSYYREGTPRTVLEAMAMGRPVITTDSPGCRETVVNGINGFLVSVRNSEALAGAMEQFLNYPELISKMGTESRRIAEEKFDVHKVNEVINQAMGLNL